MSFLPSSLVERRLVLAVPQRAEHVGKAQVVALERDQHFIADFGNELDAAIVARHRHREARPVALARLAVPRDS